MGQQHNTIDYVELPAKNAGDYARARAFYSAAFGWRYTDWPGDTQPRGFTAAEVSGPGGSGHRLGPGTAAALHRFIGPATG